MKKPIAPRKPRRPYAPYKPVKAKYTLGDGTTESHNIYSGILKSGKRHIFKNDDIKIVISKSSIKITNLKKQPKSPGMQSYEAASKKYKEERTKYEATLKRYKKNVTGYKKREELYKLNMAEYRIHLAEKKFMELCNSKRPTPDKESKK